MLHVIYGGAIHVRVLSESFILGNGNILLYEYLEVVWCQNVSHPLETCLLYGMFRSGLIPMGYARYVSLVLVTFWSILTHMFYDIMKINASWWHPGLLLYPLPPRFQSPAWGGPSEQTDPEYRFSHYTIIEQTDPEYRLSHYTINNGKKRFDAH